MMKIGRRIAHWVKDQLIERLGLPDDAELGLVVQEEGEESVPSLRFKVTAVGGRVLFVYGRDEPEARDRVPQSHSIVSIEPAGIADGGVVRLPLEETQAIMKSMVEGRIAPGA